MCGLDTTLQGLKSELHHLFRHPAQVIITLLLFLESVNSFHLEPLHLFFQLRKFFRSQLCVFLLRKDSVSTFIHKCHFPYSSSIWQERSQVYCIHYDWHHDLVQVYNLLHCSFLLYKPWVIMTPTSAVCYEHPMSWCQWIVSIVGGAWWTIVLKSIHIHFSFQNGLKCGVMQITHFPHLEGKS